MNSCSIGRQQSDDTVSILGDNAKITSSVNALPLSGSMLRNEGASSNEGAPENGKLSARGNKHPHLFGRKSRRQAVYFALICLVSVIMLDVFCCQFPFLGSSNWITASAAAKTQIWASLGDVESQWALANYYERGYGVPKDERQAIRWFTKAAERGYDVAQCDLASGYAYRFSKRDIKEAIYWWTTAAEQGSETAQYDLGYFLCVLAKEGVSVDFADVEKWWTMAAEAGNAKAQYSKFEFIIKSGVAGWKEALPWLKKAADQGLGCAQYEMGHAYEEGLGVEHDEEKAMEWYRLASKTFNEEASWGNPALRARALFCLAYMWENQKPARDGKWIDANRSAFDLYHEAALLGSVPAQYKLGCLYCGGRRGLEKNMDEALFWWKKAAIQGHEMAAVAVIQYYAEMLNTGEYRDMKEADKWAKYSNSSKYQLAHFAQIGWRAYILPF